MLDELIKTNLGKWGNTTQTYDEHVHAVWVFRKPLLALARPILHKLFGEDSEGAWTEYIRLTRFETRGHDYDKLFVPQALLPELTSFRWHAKTNDPVNQRALEAFLDQVELPCSRGVARTLLQAACAGHEGLRTPEKGEKTRTTLHAYFEERGLGLSLTNSNWLALAKLHTAVLRAADAIASAAQGQAFKDDVSTLANWITQLLPRAHLTIITISFDTTFSESSSAAVLSGYYQLYDSCYKSLHRLLERNGIVLTDNSRTLVAMALTDEAGELEAKWWKNLAGSLGDTTAVKTIVQWHQTEIAPNLQPVDFDVKLKDALWHALSQAHKIGTNPHGIPCASCGRQVITSPPREDLPKNLGDEIATLESRGDYGFVKGVKESLYELHQALNRSARLACPECISLSRYQEESTARGTLAFGGSTRKYTRDNSANLKLTSDKTDPFVTLLYGFELQRRALDTLVQTIQTAKGQSRLIASSTLLFRFTPTPTGLAATLDLIQQALTHDCETLLPDGTIQYSLDFGIRIGAGALLLNGHIHDSVFVRGVHAFDDFLSRLKVARDLDTELVTLSNEQRNKAMLRLSQRRGVIPLAKELLDSDIDLSKPLDQRNPHMALEQILQVAALVDHNPRALSDLRRFYSGANSEGGER